MKTYRVTIEFQTDAPLDLVEQTANDMDVQLESLDDYRLEKPYVVIRNSISLEKL